MRNLAKSLRCDERGTTALEFALVAPMMITMLIGTVALCVGLYLIGSLHFAVEEAARCASVKTTVCTDAASTQTYAQNHYFGPTSLAPTFTAVAAACGNSVSATITYTMNTGFATYTIPISAAACFP
jgi:Flp pilus assembly protein TadG